MKPKLLFLLLFFVIPASTNYKLDAHGIGSGGGITNSSSYSLLGTTGEQSSKTEGSSYSVWSGIQFAEMANTPPAPTFVNEDSYYNKLRITLDTGNNPTDTLYAIAISTDSFTTTEYVQSDNTVGSTLGSEDWQTYADWGGSSGEFVVGLDADTTYQVKVKAIQGDYTESPYGPSASAATSALTLSFDIDVSSIDEETASPYEVSLGSLNPDTVITATDKIWLDLSTNANNGAVIYVAGSTGGLYSNSTAHTISGVSADLTGVSEGFGLKSASVAESSGGPLTAVSPYNGSSDTVGTIATTLASLYNTSTAPISAARGSIDIKAKAQSLTPSATDYAETLTFIAAANF